MNIKTPQEMLRAGDIIHNPRIKEIKELLKNPCIQQREAQELRVELDYCNQYVSKNRGLNKPICNNTQNMV